MEAARRKPAHPLEEVKRLATQRKVAVNARAQRFIVNHMDTDDAFEIVAGVVAAMEPRHFCESQPLRVMPGQWGDVYRRVPYAGEEWYVKLHIGEDGGLMLNVLSANWEGYIH